MSSQQLHWALPGQHITAVFFSTRSNIFPKEQYSDPQGQPHIRQVSLQTSDHDKPPGLAAAASIRILGHLTTLRGLGCKAYYQLTEWPQRAQLHSGRCMASLLPKKKRGRSPKGQETTGKNLQGGCHALQRQHKGKKKLASRGDQA